MRFSPRTQHIGLIAVLTYISFIGGATYGTTTLFLRGFHQLVMSGLVIAWLVHLMRRGRPLPRTGIDMPLLAYVVWIGVTTALSHDPRVSLEQSWQLLLHVIGFLMLVYIMQRGRQKWVFEGLFLIAALVVLVSAVEIASWYFGLGFAGFTQGWLSIGGLGDPIPPYVYRLALAFNVATWLGNFVILALPLTVAWAFTARKRDDRLALRMVSVGLVVVLMLSQSRGAWLGAVAITGAWIAIRILGRAGNMMSLLGQRRVQIALALAGVVAVFIVGLVISVSSGRSGSDQGRILLWESALGITIDHPITGGGIYQFPYFFREEAALNQTTGHHRTAHNLYLNSMAETGIPGLGIMLWMGAAFLMMWWRRMQGASAAQRLRLEAILAALVGFCVQSLVDTFTFTSTVLPIFIMAAYVSAGQYHRGDTAPIHESDRRHPGYGRLRYTALIVAVVFLVWLMSINVAQFRLFQAIRNAHSDDYAEALERINAAQNLDPGLRLYDLQAAYVLGLQADDDPAQYLDAAIADYEQILQDDPNFDVGRANLAALYAQQGSYAQAIEQIEYALDVRPDINFYWLNLGQYQEEFGMEADAAESYSRALRGSGIIINPDRGFRDYLVASSFWDDLTPARESGLELALADYRPADQLLFAVNRGWSARADELAAALDPVDDANHAALGYYHASRGDDEAAIQALEATVDRHRTNAWAWAELAKAYFAAEQFDDAEKAALTARFLPENRGFQANFVLAKLRIMDGDASEDEINQLLIASVAPRVLVQAYDDPIFGHFAFLDYLPQVNTPGLGEAAYEPWLLLAERFAADDDPDTDPLDVYKAIANDDRYLDAAQHRCGWFCRG